MEETEEINFVEPSALDWIEAVLVLVISSFGFLINTGSLFVMVRSDSFKNAFGYITAYQAFCRASLLLIFAVWATPWTLFPVPEGVDGLNSFLGQLSLFFEEIACHCCLLLAANRFIAVGFPMKYRILFTNFATFVYIIFITVFVSLYWGIYFVESCDFRFSHAFRVWEFGLEPCSVFLSISVDMGYNLCLYAVVVIIDGITIAQLRKLHKEYFLRNGEVASADTRVRKETLLFIQLGIAARCSNSRVLKEELSTELTIPKLISSIKHSSILPEECIQKGCIIEFSALLPHFTFQAFSTTCVYISMLLCFHLVSQLVSRRWAFLYFLCTTFAWEMSHTLGGVTLIYFNPEIRRHFVAACGFFRVLKNSIITGHPRSVATVSAYKMETAGPMRVC